MFNFANYCDALLIFDALSRLLSLKNNKIMKRLIISLLLIVYLLPLRAVEGMLIPTLLGAFEDEMQAMGMRISAKDIFDANNASIKDAIMHFGGGCTSEIVSPKGLLLTNHHCGYSQINSHSTLENNILKHGFWASNLREELPNEGLTATRMVNIVDVTTQVLEGTDGLKGPALQQKIQTNIAQLKAEATKGTHYEADIKPFDFGNSYFLLVKETFYDVRLVGTPPNTVGKFGGDTDNWVWPRHTGDFAVFRIYADADNKPSPFSENNQPYAPLHHLPIGLKDKKEGDFTMVFGFPGLTEQHTISSELDYIIRILRPAQIRMRDLSLGEINRGMRASELTTLQYASKQARIANAWKKWIGQIDGLKRADAITVKEDYENNYQETANGDNDWKERYGQAIPELRSLATTYQNADFAYNMFIEYTYVGAEFFGHIRKFYKAFSEATEQELTTLGDDLIKSAEAFYKNYDPNIDRAIFEKQTAYYISVLDKELIPNNLANGDIQSIAETIFTKSAFTDLNRFKKLVKNLGKKTPKLLEKDPGYQLFSSIENTFYEKVLGDVRTYFALKNNWMKTYVAGKFEMFPEDRHWSDANSTLRVSYGQLEGSFPRDGMQYLPYTTMEGIMEKYNTGQDDFELLPRFIELYEKKDYRGYDQDGELWICFTGSNHTTGGNSGSPVINGEGHLMGLNFDRSWESTMSDYMFDASRCRNITVDIRYVLWMIEVYGEAGHLIEEMTLIRD